MDRFAAAIAELDHLNAQDPNLEHGRPRELVHSERLASWVKRIAPQASEALQLAAHCQHLMRWKLPRASFPAGREGYLRWRKQAQVFHADEAEKVMRRAGYGDDVVEGVRRIVQKRNLKQDAEVQAMEDALCLSFLEHELPAFAEKHDDDKVVHILTITWRKMSTAGQQIAMELAESLPERVRTLVQSALSNAD